jgi:hypothetical protein
MISAARSCGSAFPDAKAAINWAVVLTSAAFIYNRNILATVNGKRSKNMRRSSTHERIRNAPEADSGEHSQTIREKLRI